VERKNSLRNIAPTNILYFLYHQSFLDWNKDYKPAPYPKTKAEFDRAAKKYNLLPEEYIPYKDDGLGYGDYPKLPDVGVETRDPYYPYDYPELRRNFNEPVKLEIIILFNNLRNYLLFFIRFM